MNPSISIVCDAMFGAGSENFGTVTGNVTFQDGSANSGTVIGNAVFEGNAENKAGATVTGDATFGILSINNGTVSGTVVPPSTDLSPSEGQISFNQFLQYNSSTIQQYAGGGYYNGLYAFDGDPYATLAEAEAAFAAWVLESAYISWLAANVGVNQFVETGNPHNGQWAYNQTEYANEAEARTAEAAAYQTWLAANSGVNQYSGTGAKNGQWAYNQTEYASQVLAQVAKGNAEFPAWLAANTGVNQYMELGTYNGYWAYNQSVAGTYQVNGEWYTFDSNSNGVHASGRGQASDGLWYVFNGYGGASGPYNSEAEMNGEGN